MGKLILVRHGQTVSNVANRLDTRAARSRTDRAGSPASRGYAQTWVGHPPAVLVSSIALRAKQTAGYSSAAPECPSS